MASTATASALPDGSYEIAIAAADIGQGARTAITQVAADELGTDTPPGYVPASATPTTGPR